LIEPNTKTDICDWQRVRSRSRSWLSRDNVWLLFHWVNTIKNPAWRLFGIKQVSLPYQKNFFFSWS